MYRECQAAVAIGLVDGVWL